jgi:putative ABC transport system ATP-binding protein
MNPLAHQDRGSSEEARLAAAPLVLENVTVRYGSGAAAVTALRNVSLTAHAGQVTLISGPSGSGKTTLLLVASTLLTPAEGRVQVQGRDLHNANTTARAALRLQHIGFVFQSFRLFKGLGVLHNVALVSQLAGQPPAAAIARAQTLLHRLGLSHRLDEDVQTLSGGEKQRVAIARALVTNPLLVLADEPTAALDSKSGHAVGALLQELAHRDGKAVVVVSHDPRMTPFADRHIEMEDGQVVRDE